MLLTSLLGGQELASQLLNKGCRGDSEALLCWTHPKSWPRVDLGGQDRRRGGKLQGGLLLCTDLPSTAPSPAGRCWSRPAWPGGTGSGNQDCLHLEIAMKTWRLSWGEFLPMTTTSASDGTSLPRFSEVKLKARLFVRVCLCCKIVRQQNLRWSVFDKFVSSDYLKDTLRKCCDNLPVVWGLWSGEQHISCWAPSSWQRLTKTAKKCQKRGGAERGWVVAGAANPDGNWGARSRLCLLSRTGPDLWAPPSHHFRPNTA